MPADEPPPPPPPPEPASGARPAREPGPERSGFGTQPFGEVAIAGEDAAAIQEHRQGRDDQDGEAFGEGRGRAALRNADMPSIR